MESFFIALNAIVPFMCYVAFGYFVRYIKMADEAFLKKLNQLIFKAFFPVMMFNNLYGIEKGVEFNPMLLMVGVVSVLLVVGAACVVVPAIVKDNPKRGAVIQAVFRSNSVLFLVPFVISVYGEEYRMVPTVVVAVMIPLYNVLAVIVFETFRGGKVKPAALIKGVVTNPMIMGAAVGLVFYLLGINLPGCIEKPLEKFGDLCTPLGMFVLGGTLRFSQMKADMKYLIPTMVVKMILLPALILIVALQMDFAPVERFVLLAVYATPVAASSYAMAQNMGGDGELAGEFVVFSTVLCVFTLFLWIVFMGNAGILY